MSWSGQAIAVLSFTDSPGGGMIYRHCYSIPDIEKAYDELMVAGVQPEDENGEPLARTCNHRPGHA
jgi:methylmalonyl-CoA/ethylmalonyl-CoA epimerase